MEAGVDRAFRWILVVFLVFVLGIATGAGLMRVTNTIGNQGTALTINDLEPGEYFVLARSASPLNAGSTYEHRFLLTTSISGLDPIFFVGLTKSDFPDLSDLRGYTTTWGLFEAIKLDNLLRSEPMSLSSEEIFKVFNQKYKFVISLFVVVEDGKRHIVPKYAIWPPGY